MGETHPILKAAETADPGRREALRKLLEGFAACDDAGVPVFAIFEKGFSKEDNGGIFQWLVTPNNGIWGKPDEVSPSIHDPEFVKRLQNLYMGFMNTMNHALQSWYPGQFGIGRLQPAAQEEETEDDASDSFD